MTPDLPRGFRRIAFDSVGSTNDEARRFASAGAGDGLIVTAGEQRTGRGRLGREFVIVTPGIRRSSAARDDQARTTTARDALAAGASYLVVGRPILEAEDPRTAAEALVAEAAR